MILEGNYLLLDEGVWNDISTMFDEKWYICLLFYDASVLVIVLKREKIKFNFERS